MKFYVISSSTEGMQIVEADRIETRGGKLCFANQNGDRVFRRHEINFWEECQTRESAEAVRAEFQMDWLAHHPEAVPAPLRG